MASPNKDTVLISTPDHTPPTISSPLLQTTPEIHLAIFETLDQGTSMLLGLTCKYFYKIHRAFYKSPTSLLTRIDNQDHPSSLSPIPSPSIYDRYFLINYLADWFPKEPKSTDGLSFVINLAPKNNRSDHELMPFDSTKVCAVGTERMREDPENFLPENLPTLPRFRQIEISLLLPRLICIRSRHL